MSSGATRSKMGFMSKMAAVVRSKTRSKKAGLQNLRLALHERQMERNFQAGESRRRAAANAASTKRAKWLAAKLLNRSSREGTRSREGSTLRESRKLRNQRTQSEVQNPREIASGWVKTKNEFNRMSAEEQDRYIKVLEKMGYGYNVIFDRYMD